MENFLGLDANIFKPQALGVPHILEVLSVAMLLSAILYVTYILSYTALNYNKKFNITLVMMSIITTVLMSSVQTNMMLSIGMLGALSVVRFRTNVKDTRDIGFIFWALSIGITSASGNYFIGALSSIIISVLMIITSKESKNSNSLLLVVRGENVDIDIIQDIIRTNNTTYKVKAKNMLRDSFELVYELKTSKDEDNKIIDRLLKIRGIDSVNVLAPNTEVV